MKTRFSFFLMYAAFFIYSLSMIFLKLASKQAFLSARDIFCFAGAVIVLGIYALLWQQVLKNIPLSVAMSNKPVALVFSLAWAFFLFEEKMSVKTIVGVAFILVGIVAVGVDDRREGVK